MCLRFGVTCCGYRYLAFSGLPADPEFDTRHVCIMDNTLSEPIIFQHKCEEHILSMRVTPDYLLLAFHQHVELWDISGKQLIKSFSTGLNIHAPCDITNDFTVMAFAGEDPMNIRAFFVSEQKMTEFKAADDTVSLMKFSPTGTYLATTSTDGKIVQVFDTKNHICIGKFKRGHMSSVIHSIDFSPNGDFMAIISQNGTLHFFDLRIRKSSTISAFHRITIGALVLSQISWYSPSQIAVMTMKGEMINIAIDPETCHEVGREQKVFYKSFF
ncbi:svp1-like protein 2 [Histomonas meleagridis]|uniref:svp1-like protein 2 n=1 Tax=Histomonas meleagridis TaxID=135588 RepID=UPI00355A47BC|nr:svp1-like protein 2 [Histomonas meleagridis]KAH0807184.1 svp1-like protein 2 [Histomonas meleagridis]